MGGSSLYDTEFHEETGALAQRSAEIVVPMVLEYVTPKSVIDIGCGLGAWLAEFQKHGVSEILGVDGDSIDRDTLLIPEDRFRAVDLAQSFELSETADLVVCLEVAEHLPEPAGEQLIEVLTEAAPVVLFSAAVPGQGGTHHINEQWPDYWAERFQEHGYTAVDCLRDRIWDDEEVAWYYAQNMMFFVGWTSNAPELAPQSPSPPQRRLHPRSPLAEWEAAREAVQEAVEGLPEPGTAVLVDDARLVLGSRLKRPTRRFMEEEESYRGPPADAAAAIDKVERLTKDRQIRYLVISFPAFWWLDFYPAFSSWLRRSFPCVVENDHLVAFDLRPQGKPLATHPSPARDG